MACAPAHWFVPALLLVWASGCRSAVEPPVDPLQGLRQALQLPRLRLELKAQSGKHWKKRDLNYEAVSLQGRHDKRIEGLLCYSDLAAAAPLPALLFMPGSSDAKEDLWRPRDLLGHFADAGFVVMSLDRRYRGAGELAAAVAERGLVPTWGEFVYDLQHGLDYLAQRAEVDPRRLGALGLSLGGWEALILAAIDSRVGAVVCAGGHVVWSQVFAGERWQMIFPALPLTKRLKAAGIGGQEARTEFFRNHPGLKTIGATQLLPMIAPRPQMLLVGESDPLVGGLEGLLAEVGPRYAAFPSRLRGVVERRTGHRFSTGMRDSATAFLKRFLGRPRVE